MPPNNRYTRKFELTFSSYSLGAGEIEKHVDNEGYTWIAQSFKSTESISLKILCLDKHKLITRLIKIRFSEDTCKYSVQKAFNFRLGKALVFDDLNKIHLIDRSYIRASIFIEHTNEEVDSIPVPPPSSTEDLGSMFKGGDFSIVKICVDSIEFNVHKTILSNRCPVFKEMFNDESTENVVMINDVDAEIMIKLLHFIYTDQVDLQEKALEKWITLYQAADKYKLNRLKVICENVLVKSLTVETAVELLIQADRCKSHELKEEIIQFIIVNSRLVLASEAWKRMLNERYKFINEILLASNKIIISKINQPAQRII